MTPDEILKLKDLDAQVLAAKILCHYKPSPATVLSSVREIEIEMAEHGFRKYSARVTSDDPTQATLGEYDGLMWFVPRQTVGLPKAPGVPYNNFGTVQDFAICRAALIAISLAGQWPLDKPAASARSPAST
jgi:hypothetical protein